MEAKDYLRAVRESGLTQTEVSVRCGIPQPTISKIERCESRDVLSKNFLALQRLYQEMSQAGELQAVKPVAV